MSSDLAPQLSFVCGATAGVTTSLVTNPIWMIKTRLQVQEIPKKGKLNETIISSVGEQKEILQAPKYKNATDAFIRIVREEGFLALWKGIGPGLGLVANGALQFMFYDEMKRIWKKYFMEKIELKEEWKRSSDAEHQLNSLHFLAMGGTAKILSTTLTYPLQVFRSRMYQKQNLDVSFFQVVRKTLAMQGIRGFYQGYIPHCAKTGVASAFTFVAYENFLKLLEIAID